MRSERPRTVAVLAVALVVLAGTGPAAAHDYHGYELHAWGQFGPARGQHVPTAVTYDRKLVPTGARIDVRQWISGPATADPGRQDEPAADGRMTVELRVTGVRPGHTFGAHVHAEPCGADPADSGPHYQHRPGTDPALANPANEVWLDVTADADGVGESVAVQRWIFRSGEAGSVVLHERATSTGHGDHEQPGDAGARVACFTVPFAPPGVAAGGGVQ